VLDVHVNRSPIYGRVTAIRHKPGEHLNALKPESAERNESATLTLHHPTHGHPVAVVRQIAGSIARRIVCGVEEGEILQRGQRFGLIKFGSTTELYLPQPDRVRVEVREGQYVYGGATLVAMVGSPHPVGEAGRAGAAAPVGATTTASSPSSPEDSSAASSASSSEA
jgi:phosphatidylserine decarboxylase